jgi:kinesin family protein 5
VLGVDRRKA